MKNLFKVTTAIAITCLAISIFALGFLLLTIMIDALFDSFGLVQVLVGIMMLCVFLSFIIIYEDAKKHRQRKNRSKK